MVLTPLSHCVPGRKEQRFWDGHKAVYVVLLGSTVMLPCVNRKSVWTEGGSEEEQQVCVSVTVCVCYGVCVLPCVSVTMGVCYCVCLLLCVCYHVCLLLWVSVTVCVCYHVCVTMSVCYYVCLLLCVYTALHTRFSSYKKLNAL